MAGRWRYLAVAVLVLLVASCATVRGARDAVVYYSQAVHGQLGVLAARRAIDKVLVDPATDEALVRQLRLVKQLTAYASTELDLPVDGRYGSYVDWQDSALVWNVIAAPEFSVEAVRRCFPIVGCVPYRGYFSRRMADREAERLESDHDVIVAGAAAYSTLGWFKDPVVSTFVHRREGSLAELIFHELAHGVVYFKGDAGFSEAFATFVGREGASRWLAANGGESIDWEQRAEQEIAFYAFLRERRAGLAEIYASGDSPGEMRARKEAEIDAIHACYDANRERLGDGLFDRFMETRLDNARLALLSTYHRLVPQFDSLFRSLEGDWSRFYARVIELDKNAYDERREALRLVHEESVGNSAEEDEDRRRDDEGADQIQCEPLARHPLGRHATG